VKLNLWLYKAQTFGGVKGCHEATLVRSIYTRGKPAVSHVPSWKMRWKGSLTALASVFCRLHLERHAWPCISRQGSEDANKKYIIGNAKL